ncbi:MAG: UDP-N-acetylglucosamine 1-carboxyvinyltransferase [bacterium]|nr:UDP-N-acetylglucosamine 1-carboxyvinyltransferase [bacterium]
MTKQQQIGALIEDIREEKNITQSELAKLLKTSQSAVARIEKGDQNLTTETLSKISKALGRDLFVLTKGTINFQIEGGRKLSGEVMMNTSKNGAVGLLCASLLNKGKTVLKKVPKIEEVHRLIEVLQSIGVSVRWNKNDLEIDASKKINLKNIDIDAAMKTRSIIMFIGPLIHRFKDFSLPSAGGCKLGSRTVRPHFYALEKYGVKITSKKGEYEVEIKNKLRPAYNVLYESGDTVTENAIMAAALIPGKTTIKFASANYQVQELCFFLEELGVKISGIGTSTLIMHGLEQIKQKIEYQLSEDPTEAMFFLAAAVCTKSSITLRRVPIDFLELELLKLEKMGFRYEILKEYKAKNKRTRLVDLKTFPSKLKALEEKIHPDIFPGLNMDNLPFFAVIATQAKGRTLIHDWPYEKRALYFTELDKLGAETVLADPHRIYIDGQTELRANDLVCPPALRPATILLIAMLAAKGSSMLRNVYSINRGYEDLATRLNKLGAKVRLVHEL